MFFPIFYNQGLKISTAIKSRTIDNSDRLRDADIRKACAIIKYNTSNSFDGVANIDVRESCAIIVFTNDYYSTFCK